MGRVHAQAGQATVDPKTREVKGPVLKTIVDREPRVAGDIVESWNGYDESGTAFVPDLPNFVMGVLAASLPKSSIITVGNRNVDAVTYARRTRGEAALKPRVLSAPHGRHRHHMGLNLLEDHSPLLTLKTSGTWSGVERRWQVAPGFSVTVEVDAKQAPFFLSQPNTLYVYVDQQRVAEVVRPPNPAEVQIPAADVAPGEHRLAVNWASQFGPAGVQVAKIVIGEASASHGGAR
jgi:hypothetical protein